jgi:hypothetical protein
MDRTDRTGFKAGYEVEARLLQRIGDFPEEIHICPDTGYLDEK